jgi:putative transposase
VLPGLAHHVTQRGNNRQNVFVDDEDHRSYLALLKKQCGKERLTVIGYCLMSNHVHLVVRPASGLALARAIGRVHFAYAQRFNARHGRSGHLWQGRFYSCALEETLLPAVLRYIETNPVRAGMVGAAVKYPWSSAAVHVNGGDSAGLTDMSERHALATGEEWSLFLGSPTEPADTEELRRRTGTGRPLGSDAFLLQMERRSKQSLRPRPVGRPGKAQRQPDSKK